MYRTQVTEVLEAEGWRAVKREGSDTIYRHVDEADRRWVVGSQSCRVQRLINGEWVKWQMFYTNRASWEDFGLFYGVKVVSNPN